MPDVKLTLTAEEKEVLAKLRATEQGLDQLEASANKAGKAFDLLFSKMSKAVSVHGNLRPSQIAQQLVGNLSPSGASLAAASGMDRPAMAQATSGLRAYADKLRANILGDVKKMAAVTAAEQRHYGSMTPEAAKSQRRSVTSFIKSQDLGDVDGDVNKFVGRIVRQQLKTAQRAIIQSAQEVGGSHELLQLARAQGVNVGKPSEVRRFVAERAHQMEVAQSSATEAQASVARQMEGEQARRAQQAAERARITQAYLTDDLAKRHGAADTRRDFQQLRQDQDVGRPTLEERTTGKKYSRDGAGRRRLADRGEHVAGRGGDLLGDAQQEFNQAADEEASKWSTFTGSRKRAAMERRRILGRGSLRGGVDYTAEGAAPGMGDEVNLVGGAGLLAGGSSAVSAESLAAREAASLVRSNRSARLRQLQAQKTMSGWDAGLQIASGIAGAGAAGIYAGENVLGNYNQRLGGDYFDALKGIEPTFRGVASIGDNADKQKALRQTIRDAAITYGQNVPEASGFFYDVYSSAGNLTDAKQAEIIKSSLRLQSVTGGELPVIGKAMTTIQNLYGSKIGSTDRAASIIKKTIDYGKFDPTAFASLAPEPLSTAAAYGISFEDASALMAVVSTRSGRDMNMFTGARYLFKNMHKAADEGLVNRNADFLTQVRQLRKSTPQQREKAFGQEGFNVATNAADMIDDIVKLRDLNNQQTGRELPAQQVRLHADPVATASRFAQSADVAGANILPLLIEHGGPEGARLAGESIKTRLAMAGQSATAPGIASLTDVTKNIDLERHKDEYAGLAFDAVQNALASQGDADSRHQMQTNRLVMGKERMPVELGFWDKVLGDQDSTRETTQADVSLFEKMRKDENAPELHAGEFTQVVRARADGGLGESYAQRVLAQARARSAAVEAGGDGRVGLWQAVKGGAGAATRGIANSLANGLKERAYTDDQAAKIVGGRMRASMRGKDGKTYQSFEPIDEADHYRAFIRVNPTLSSMTAAEYEQIRSHAIFDPETRSSDFNQPENKPIIDRVRARQKEGTWAGQKSGGGVFDLIPQSVKDRLKPYTDKIPNGGKIEDTWNSAVIKSSFNSAEKALADAKKGGNPFDIDEARSKLEGMKKRRRELTFDDDGLTATDRRTLASEFTGGGTVQDPSEVMMQAVQAFAAAVADFKGGTPGEKPSPGSATQPASGVPVTNKRPVSGPTTRPNP